MAKAPNTALATTTEAKRAPSKRELQRQIGRTRESLSNTVEEIKETAEQGYASVKETVSGVLDYREEFQKEPLVWSLGALSAGFALGYTVGYAHKMSRGKHSQLAQFTDRMVSEISHVGEKLVMPALSFKIKDFFGFDFSEMLRDMGGQRKRIKGSSRPKRRALKSSPKRSRQRRKKK